jgi:hypothetical protein
MTHKEIAGKIKQKLSEKGFWTSELIEPKPEDTVSFRFNMLLTSSDLLDGWTVFNSGTIILSGIEASQIVDVDAFVDKAVAAQLAKFASVMAAASEKANQMVAENEAQARH